MAFVNEYISEEDIKKNQLDAQYLKRHPEYKAIPPGFKPQWTINRKENIILQLTARAHQAYVDESWTEFELNWAGKIFLCRLKPGAGESIKFSEVPFIIVWDLISIKPDHLHQMAREQVIEVLKEALTVFGYDGARKQIPNTIVKFGF
jgi:hypothetical protein